MFKREVFEYEIDGKTRFADPLATWDKLTIALHGDPFGFCQRAAESEDPVAAAQSTQQIAEAVISAFDLPRFDPETGTGATIHDCLAIWAKLVEFNAECKKKRDVSPTCQVRFT